MREIVLDKDVYCTFVHGPSGKEVENGWLKPGWKVSYDEGVEPPADDDRILVYVEEPDGAYYAKVRPADLQ
jgi:hypothetical protein